MAVVYLFHGCRLASAIPIIMIGIKMVESIAVTMMMSVIVFPFVVSCACIIPKASPFVNPYRDEFQNYWKVFYLPHGYRLASETPIIMIGMMMMASMAIVMM